MKTQWLLGEALCHGGRAAWYIADQHPRRERELDFRSVFVFVA
jgi:hypothetical protein